MKFLFIGNSYTFFHDMPTSLFLPLVRTADPKAEVTSVTRGGWYLSRFADPKNEEGIRLREVIRDEHYDCVVLQDQSCNPVRNEEKFIASVGALKALLEPHTTHFVLYSTWGRCDGNPMLAELGLSSKEMTERLDAAYCRAGEVWGMTVARVGRAFWEYGAEPPVKELYDPDLSHPSLAGSRLAASVIWDAVKQELAR